jgi:dihydroorotase
MGKNPLFLKNAQIVNEGNIFKGHLLISDGKIECIFLFGQEPSISEDIPVIDLEGMHLLPGVIDDQVHFREPGLVHKGDIFSESRAAVAGGITSYMEMPNTNPQTTNQKALDEKFDIAARNSMANYSFYLGATNENIDQIRATDINNVCGIKVFMGSSTGNMLVDDPDTLSKIFREAKLLVAVHCEDEITIQKNLQDAISAFGEDIPIEHHPVIRNHEACYLSSSKAVELAKRHGTRLHVLHLSTHQETELFTNSIPLEHKQITAEACVHHLWFTDKDYKDKGAFIKWNPAIKTQADRDGLREALKNGTIDVVATDHAPHTLEEKQRSYTKSPSGGPLVQHALPAMLEMVHQKVFTLQQIATFMCHNPAILFGVKNRGFIRKGYAADLVAVKLDQPALVEPSQLLYKCGWSPFSGYTFRSSVQYTFVNGVSVFEKGKILERKNSMALEFSR